MEEFEVTWWEESSESSKQRKTNRLRRHISICLVSTILLAAGAVVAGVVVSKQNKVNANTSAVEDEDGGGSNRTCNGVEANCYRRVNEIMYATMHNAMATLADNFYVAYNHILSLEDALEAGVRGIMLDTCLCQGIGVQLCHGTCSVGFRKPVPTFTAILEFLAANPNEIVIIELQIGEESFEPLIEKLMEVPGLMEKMYHHYNRTEPWPIIHDLIDKNTTLIVFQHDGPDCDSGECPLGFHNTYTHVWETPWNTTGAEELLNISMSCVRSRGRRSGQFMLSNHFAHNAYALPEQAIAEEVNLAENIRYRSDACTELLGRSTTLLAVDFWSIGDTLAVVQEYNENLPAITQSPTSSPVPSANPSQAPNSQYAGPAPTASTSPPSPAPSVETSSPTIEASLAPSGQVNATFSPTTTTSAPSMGST